MCTGIFLKTKNNKYIFARTLEFGLQLNWVQSCTGFIKGTIGYFPNDSEGFMTDGVNAYGLFVGTFFYPHYHYEYNKERDPNKINLETGNVNLFLLKSCKSVSDVIAILGRLNIRESIIKNTRFSLHWIVCDTTGKCIVIEVKDKQILFYNNVHNVITNSPDFPNHVSELKNYRYLSKYNKPGSWSEGTGAIGLPGDGSSTSRFVRANFYRKNMVTPKNTKDGIDAILRVLHNFDIPLGTVEDPQTGEKEVTEYTVAYSLNHFYSQYADYGYIMDRSGNWIQTASPVRICNINVGRSVIVFILVLILLVILCFQH